MSLERIALSVACTLRDLKMAVAVSVMSIFQVNDRLNLLNLTAIYSVEQYFFRLFPLCACAGVCVCACACTREPSTFTMSRKVHSHNIVYHWRERRKKKSALDTCNRSMTLEEKILSIVNRRERERHRHRQSGGQCRMSIPPAIHMQSDVQKQLHRHARLSSFAISLLLPSTCVTFHPSFPLYLFCALSPLASYSIILYLQCVQ